ncbi:acyloxyacyl hydrolase [Variovorax sp.]|uniref:acyloxyacyl hydrolase n=1 Tax=Variovorax sp. TaxID=1871043 RepID=UPI002D526A22|nr:acyloxyacyl hydrolase [Variovorax sp.]HYP82428.1 acyloxyacyl hydrolase [Variovorax sp.]
MKKKKNWNEKALPAQRAGTLRNRPWWLALFLAVSVAAPGTALAFGDQARGVYFDAGGVPVADLDVGTWVAGIGVLLPWKLDALPAGGAHSFYWDLFLNNWNAQDDFDSHTNFAQVGAALYWRYRFDEGRSPWYGELGLGGSLMDRLYHTPERQFSTRFQFTEAIGMGLSLGDHGQHELGLRIQHFSNADIRLPNPGETFLRLRYAYRF